MLLILYIKSSLTPQERTFFKPVVIKTMSQISYECFPFWEFSFLQGEMQKNGIVINFTYP